jgi:hypothetical protein
MCFAGLLDHGAITVCIAILQFVGLASAAATRVSIGLRTAAIFQMFYFVCLFLVAAGTVVAVATHLNCWFYSSTTFAIMVLAVTCDFRNRNRVTIW